MIREAQRADLLAILRMGRAFSEAINETHDRESIVQTAEWLMTDPGATLQVWENGEIHGMAAAILVPVFIDRSRTQATELFWWVDPDSRQSGAGRDLLNGLESWAKAQGAARLSMMSMHSLDNGVGKLYERAGYVLTEQTYIKDF